MTPRERVETTLAHREPDQVPLDVGSSTVTGMHVSSVYRLRQALALDPPGTPVKVTEPYLMLGEMAPDLLDALGADVIGLWPPRTFFGFPNSNWKEWRLSDGTPVLVSEYFNTEPQPDGSILQYPQGDRSVPPSGHMPAGGFYFDSIVRQAPIDEVALDPAENLEEFGPISDADLAHWEREAKRVFDGTDRATIANFGGTGFGDIALVPAPWLKHPRGIRDVAEWYVSLAQRRDYIHRVFERQCEIGIANLERIHRVVGERVTAVRITGTDFGAQQGPFLSPQTYRELFLPFHRAVNDWVHQHTTWKTFIHSCGSVRRLLPDFIEAGFDILNPVQCSAAEMDPAELKQQYGHRLVLWGGGVDTQCTLPFGTPAEVREEVRSRMRIFSPGGGFVFAAVHNIQAGVPTENLVALFEAAQDRR